jgi:hypothetical protein
MCLCVCARDYLFMEKKLRLTLDGYNVISDFEFPYFGIQLDGKDEDEDADEDEKSERTTKPNSICMIEIICVLATAKKISMF